MQRFSLTLARFRVHASILMLLFVVAGGHAGAQEAFDLPGSWLGTLNLSGQKLRVVFHIERIAGAYSAKLDSPDQGAKGIPVPEVRWSHDSLILGIPALMGKYVGKRVSDTSISGTWTQGGISLLLDLVRTDKPIVLNRPQTPKPPYPYDEEEVTFENAAAGIALAGTLTKPRSGMPFPCVVLISGSGPQNRNESIFGHDPFHVLADYLTRHGIAVLRYDDRGIGGSTGSFASSTTDDFATDTRAAVSWLKGRKDIDPERIGLIGHSEGGIVAPMVAADSKDIAFVVLLAGTGLVGEEILYMQQELIMRVSGATQDEIRREQDYQRKLYTLLKSEKDTAVVHEKALGLWRDRIASYPDSAPETAVRSEAVFEAAFRSMVSPWFVRFLTLDPKIALRRVSCPVLAVNGELDLQVPCKENLAAIEAALWEGGNRDVTTIPFPGLNHLFQTATTGSPSEYSTIEETFSPKALEAIATWIQGKVAK